VASRPAGRFAHPDDPRDPMQGDAETVFFDL
jgi:hypothetical protein